MTLLMAGPHPVDEKKAAAARGLLASGAIVGKLMSYEDANKLGKRAREMANAIDTMFRGCQVSRVYGIAGGIVDELRAVGATMAEIQIVAEGFGGMRTTCSPSTDLHWFNVGLFAAKRELRRQA